MLSDLDPSGPWRVAAGPASLTVMAPRAEASREGPAGAQARGEQEGRACSRDESPGLARCCFYFILNRFVHSMLSACTARPCREVVGGEPWHPNPVSPPDPAGRRGPAGVASRDTSGSPPRTPPMSSLNLDAAVGGLGWLEQKRGGDGASGCVSSATVGNRTADLPRHAQAEPRWP